MKGTLGWTPPNITSFGLLDIGDNFRFPEIQGVWNPNRPYHLKTEEVQLINNKYINAINLATGKYTVISSGELVEVDEFLPSHKQSITLG